jgi:hypothetical protein
VDLDQVRLRLIRADDVPISHDLDEPYAFGLQDTKQVIVPGARQSDGTLVFDGFAGAAAEVCRRPGV